MDKNNGSSSVAASPIKKNIRSDAVQVPDKGSTFSIREFLKQEHISQMLNYNSMKKGALIQR